MWENMEDTECWEGVMVSMQRNQVVALWTALVLVITVLGASAAAAHEREAELRAHFTFDGTLADATGNFGKAQVTGDRIYKACGAISFADGAVGQALELLGSAGVRLPDGLITGYSYAVSLWMNPRELTAFTTTFFGGLAADDRQQWISLVPVGPGGSTMVWSGNDPWYDATAHLTVGTDRWTHVVFSVDQGEISVYVNGRERFWGRDFPDVFTGAQAVFAVGVNYWDPPFQGRIADLRIYDGPVSEATIRWLAAGSEPITTAGPEFRNVSVHDPMVTKVDDTFYIFGSHLAAAKSTDLIQWQQIAGDWNADNPIIPNPQEALREALEWPEPDAESTWAKSVIELNGQYYMYFSAAHWHSARSNISLAIADDIEGPYVYQGMLLKKYENGEFSAEAGEPFNYDIHPGVIDPHVFFDEAGVLWMVYGSYAGGMHILELDPRSGHPKPGQGYGTRIAGGNHAPMEGPFIQYHPETGYYYLLVTFGTLAPDGGYNIRVARSEHPDGPYVDPAGNAMDLFIEKGINGRNWDNAEPYGAKLVGNFQFVQSGIGYISPGHNSAYYDEDTGELFAIFHSRFPGMGHMHSVRVHQLFLNSEGWLVMAPHRYSGEKLVPVDVSDVVGHYQYINHGQRIQRTFGRDGGDVIRSRNIQLQSDRTITGAVEGTWALVNDFEVEMTIRDNVYYGVFLEQWDDGLQDTVMTFTALSNKNIAIWGSGF